MGISDCHPCLAADDPFRPGWIRILRGGGCEARQCVAVVPWHPLRALLQLVGVPLQLGRIVERIGSVQLAGMDRTHERIADSGAIRRLLEECVACGTVSSTNAGLVDLRWTVGIPPSRFFSPT